MAADGRIKWEYGNFIASSVGEDTKVISINGQLQNPDRDIRYPFEVLNEMGDAGWELVAVHTVIPPSPNAVIPRSVWSYVLKRPK